MSQLLYPQLRDGLLRAYCPSVDRSRSDRLTDFSAYNNHGTLTSMDPATDWVAREGKIALDFDGSNDIVSIPSISLTGKKTISLWVRPAAAISSVLIGGTNGNYWPYISGGSIYVSDGVIGFAGPISDTAVTTGQWYNYCVTSDGTTVRVYKNGTQLGTMDNRNPTLNTIAAYAAATLVFNGSMDDIRIYSRDLSPSEVSLLAIRRGIAYELDRKRRAYVAGAGGGGFKSYWASHNSASIGCGV